MKRLNRYLNDSLEKPCQLQNCRTTKNEMKCIQALEHLYHPLPFSIVKSRPTTIPDQVEFINRGFVNMHENLYFM